MHWQVFAESYDAGKIARFEMLASLKRYLYFVPEDEAEVIEFVCQHPDPTVSTYGVEFKQWIGEMRSQPRRGEIANSSHVVNLVPIRPRVALLLAAAERVLPLLANKRDAFNGAQHALDDGWRWVRGEPISASAIYKRHFAYLAAQGSLMHDKDEAESLRTAISAMYYLMWHAFRQECEHGLIKGGEVPNDFKDVSEDVLNEGYNSALKTSLCDARWLASIAFKLSRDFEYNYPYELGPAVSRGYFAG